MIKNLILSSLAGLLLASVGFAQDVEIKPTLPTTDLIYIASWTSGINMMQDSAISRDDMSRDFTHELRGTAGAAGLAVAGQGTLWSKAKAARAMGMPDEDLLNILRAAKEVDDLLKDVPGPRPPEPSRTLAVNYTFSVEAFSRGGGIRIQDIGAAGGDARVTLKLEASIYLIGADGSLVQGISQPKALTTTVSLGKDIEVDFSSGKGLFRILGLGGGGIAYSERKSVSLPAHFRELERKMAEQIMANILH